MSITRRILLAEGRAKVPLFSEPMQFRAPEYRVSNLRLRCNCGSQLSTLSSATPYLANFHIVQRSTISRKPVPSFFPNDDYPGPVWCNDTEKDNIELLQ